MRIQAQNGNWIAQKCSNCKFGSYELSDDCTDVWTSCEFRAMRAEGKLPNEHWHGCFRPHPYLLSIWGEDVISSPGDPGFEDACEAHVPEIY